MIEVSVIRSASCASVASRDARAASVMILMRWR
jgi:hypothetical protein